MKKVFAIFTIAAIALSVIATPAFAKEGKNKHDDREDRGLRLGKIMSEFKGELKLHDDKHNNDLASNQFILMGTVGSTTSGSIVVNVKGSVHVPTLTNNLATINVDSNTKFLANKNQTVTLAEIKVGQQVVIKGTVSGSTLTATMVHIMFPKGKAYGEVTAKTDTSITIKNSVTGTTQTFTTNSDTEVKVNSESKTITDVQVGDKGFVKFKATLSGMVAKVINLFR
jgi:hypothetical protein